MMKYDYIFLDLDGPLLDGRERHYKCYLDILKKYGGNPISLEQFWDMKRNRVNRQELLGLSCFGGSYDDYMREWFDRIEQKEYLQYDVLWSDAICSIERLKQHTDKIVLITMRRNKNGLKWQLAKFKINDLFDEVICGELDYRKTKYELIKDISFDRALFIGDTEVDIETAKLSGSKFKGVLNGLRNEEVFGDEERYSCIGELSMNL